VLANPLCVDSPLGNAETYLSTDVPAWIQANLQVTGNHRDWFIGGMSHGGTCSLQLAVRAPQVYGGFVDISGQREPTLGSRARTVERAFGGSSAAFARVNPLDILAHARYPHTAGFLVVGSSDQTYVPQQRAVRDACTAAGMDITWVELPGAHTVPVWREGLVRALPWLGMHAGIAGPAVQRLAPRTGRRSRAVIFSEGRITSGVVDRAAYRRGAPRLRSRFAVMPSRNEAQMRALLQPQQRL